MRGFEQLVWRVVTNPHTGILLKMVTVFYLKVLSNAFLEIAIYKNLIDLSLAGKPFNY